MAPGPKRSTLKWEQKQQGPAAPSPANAAFSDAACRSSFDQARECLAVCKPGFIPRLTPEGATPASLCSDAFLAPEITPETIVSWADASMWEDSSTQGSSTPRLPKKPQEEDGACPEEIPQSAVPESLDEKPAKSSRRSHRRRRRNRGAAEATLASQAGGCASEMQARPPPNVVTLGDLGFDLGPGGALLDASIPTFSMPARSPSAASTSVPSPCRGGMSGGSLRPQPTPLSTGMSTMSTLLEDYPTSPSKATRDASSRHALPAPVAVGPWNMSGAPPGNLSPVHSTPLAMRAPSVHIEACTTVPAPASNQPVTPGPQSPTLPSGIMSTQPMPQPQQGTWSAAHRMCADVNEASDRVPAWSPAGTHQADMLRSCWHAGGLQFHTDLAEQLRAAAPQVYED